MVGYILLGYLLAFGTKTVGYSRTTMTLVIVFAGALWLAATVAAGAWSDRVGRKPVYLVGYLLILAVSIPFFLLLEARNLALVYLATAIVSAGLGLTYGAQSALYAELFPAHVRYSGASFAYALGAIVGGGFAPFIADLLLQKTGTSMSIAAYMMTVAAVSLLATWAIRKTDLNGFGDDRSPAQQ
ncbi:MFS transporter [Nonomuraea lactucae]|uniref:MFS transporter n=1 Tax=Nonomuraea lactucae TaxID=2249762 RepID=UPI001F062BB1|nr:MFS transporter [Nonomuraea lactucae]